MNKSVKGVAIAAAAMITIGILLVAFGWLAGGNQPIYFDKKGIHVGERSASNYGTLESFSQDIDGFSSIDVDLDYYDVDLVAGDKFAVDGAYFSKEGKPDIKVENDTLIIRDKEHKGVSIDIDIPGLFSYNNQPSIKIYYPKDTELKDLVLKCDASDLGYENLTLAGKADFELDYGSLDINGLNAENIVVSMDSGDCTLKNIKTDDLNLANDMGKITLEGVDVNKIKVDTNSGDVSLTDVSADYGELYLDMGKLTGRNLTTDGLKAEGNSGDIDLQGNLMGLTDITCDMGAVTVNPGASKDQFNYELNVDLGSITIGEEKAGGSVAFSNPEAKNTLKINSDMGDIRVNFD